MGAMAGTWRAAVEALERMVGVLLVVAIVIKENKTPAPPPGKESPVPLGQRTVNVARQQRPDMLKTAD